ncbi:MAG: DUF1579 family protein [Planctomycetota bacterium]
MHANKVILGALALLVTAAAGFAAGTANSQEAAKSPLSAEHKWLASLAGDYTVKVSGMMGESDGTHRIESKLGGLWSVSHFESKMMGQPFQGLEVMGFDPLKKKFVSIWVDSMNPLMTTLEGTYDADTKTLTMRGLSRGMDGEKAEMVNTTKFRDGGMVFSMNIEGTPGPLMTIDYNQKK